MESPKVTRLRTLTPDERLKFKLNALRKCAQTHDLLMQPVSKYVVAFFSGTDKIGTIQIEPDRKTDAICLRVDKRTTARASQAIRWMWAAHKNGLKA